ncbi:MAG: OsmC family protein [Planctomycetes bacterium]|nr:OsmC family protein [Planctomycetota bacterium]
MVPFTATYQGQLRCVAVHGPSKTQLVTDAPVDNHGRGESFSPTDLVVTGLGTCMLTTMGIAAQREQAPLSDIRIAYEKHMTTAPPRRIAKIVVRFTMAAGIPAARRPVLERAAHTCPVALSLHPDIVLDVSFTYPD